MLSSFKQEKDLASLSGFSDKLILVGGGSERGLLTICEKYFVNLNKWGELPPLNIARYWPGSTLLRSNRAFCFTGL